MLPSGGKILALLLCYYAVTRRMQAAPHSTYPEGMEGGVSPPASYKQITFWSLRHSVERHISNIPLDAAFISKFRGSTPTSEARLGHSFDPYWEKLIQDSTQGDYELLMRPTTYMYLKSVSPLRVAWSSTFYSCSRLLHLGSCRKSSFRFLVSALLKIVSQWCIFHLGQSNRSVLFSVPMRYRNCWLCNYLICFRGAWCRSDGFIM